MRITQLVTIPIMLSVKSRCRDPKTSGITKPKMFLLFQSLHIWKTMARLCLDTTVPLESLIESMKKHKGRVHPFQMITAQAKIHLYTTLVDEPLQTKNYSHPNLQQSSQHKDNNGKGLKITIKYLKNSHLQIIQLVLVRIHQKELLGFAKKIKWNLSYRGLSSWIRLKHKDFKSQLLLKKVMASQLMTIC